MDMCLLSLAVVAPQNRGCGGREGADTYLYIIIKATLKEINKY